uniref:YqgF/RNase H-like domain-containing protein n=1 Tax=Mola mola TaxID=94237 RepID=A0A3Q3WLH9_MOLML
QTASSEEDNEEWRPKPKVSGKNARNAATGGLKAAVKRNAKTKEAKGSKQPKTPKLLKEPKPRIPRKPAAKQKTQAGNVLKSSSKSRVSFIVSEAHWSNVLAGEGSSVPVLTAKKEEVKEDDFTFDEPCQKKQKTSGVCLGQPTALPSSGAQALMNELNMNWDLIKVLNYVCTVFYHWVCMNIIVMVQEENTVPFMVRYRKEKINYMDADAVRDVLLVYGELCFLAKKTQSVIQTLKKDGILTTELEQNLRSCQSADELDHVYSPYKKDSKLTKARRAKALGLESAAAVLMDTPHKLDLRAWIKSGTEGLSSVEEVAKGVEHILADVIAKDPETLTYVKKSCENSMVTIQSSVSKSALKEKEPEKSIQGNKKTGAQQNKNKDINKFHLYFDFTCNIKCIQPHQTLAINRGESLKILTVKVNIPDRVKSDFSRWCINKRWRPKTFAREELHVIIRNAVEDSYKRLILPFLTRSYRTKLTSVAEKESIAMFVRNLRQRLLVCPVRGCVIMGVDPGYKHGCKLAILSPTSQILHTDILYLHYRGQQQEAEKLRFLMNRYSCTRVVIGNGTACRETESFFSDLISKDYFHPLDVSYCITNEAGASIYSVSPEAVKEMPDMDPNLRSAVSIGRRVQDPLAELVKIDPKHIGIGTYQHDVSPKGLKAALDGVVQECVSFVGVDINLCSEALMRHVAGLNMGRAKNIAEWRERNGPFINREQLKLVKGMGPKTYQQCAGFIRINPQTRCICKLYIQIHRLTQKCREKGKGKTCVNIPTSFNPLDQTCIHPESYHVAQRYSTQKNCIYKYRTEGPQQGTCHSCPPCMNIVLLKIYLYRYRYILTENYFHFYIHFHTFCPPVHATSLYF